MKSIKRQVILPKGVKICKKQNKLAILTDYNSTIYLTIPQKIELKKQEKHLFLIGDIASKNLLFSFYFFFCNILAGASRPFIARLSLKGIGYKAAKLNENTLELKLGYSHTSVHKINPFIIPYVYKSNIIELRTTFKDKIGSEAASLQKLRKPDCYKGKGILYKGEKISLKVGKKV